MGEADVGLAPAVAIGGVEHEDRGQDLVRELPQEINCREAQQLAMGGEQAERPDRIGTPPGEGHALLRRHPARAGEHLHR